MPTRLSEVEISTAPAVEPVTTALMKTWLKIDSGFTDDDTIIDNCVTSARQIVEGYLNRALINQTVKAYYSSFDEKVRLPLIPVSSITSVKRKRLNQSTTLTLNTDYYVQGVADQYLYITNPLDVVPGTSPRDTLEGFELEVEYVAGYGTAASDIPTDIVLGVKQVAAWIYTHRMDDDIKGSQGLTKGVKQLLNRYRVFPV